MQKNSYCPSPCYVTRSLFSNDQVHLEYGKTVERDTMWEYERTKHFAD